MRAAAEWRLAGVDGHEGASGSKEEEWHPREPGVSVVFGPLAWLCTRHSPQNCWVQLLTHMTASEKSEPTDSIGITWLCPVHTMLPETQHGSPFRIPAWHLVHPLSQDSRLSSALVNFFKTITSFLALESHRVLIILACGRVQKYMKTGCF